MCDTKYVRCLSIWPVHSHTHTPTRRNPVRSCPKTNFQDYRQALRRRHLFVVLWFWWNRLLLFIAHLEFISCVTASTSQSCAEPLSERCLFYSCVCRRFETRMGHLISNIKFDICCRPPNQPTRKSNMYGDCTQRTHNRVVVPAFARTITTVKRMKRQIDICAVQMWVFHVGYMQWVFGIYAIGHWQYESTWFVLPKLEMLIRIHNIYFY